MDLDKQKVYPTDVKRSCINFHGWKSFFDEFNPETFQNKS